jgi:hypothetical protein
MTRITASRAKGEFGLTEDDLDGLGCEHVRNPHYRSAAPMRLYELAEVESMVETKRAARAAAFSARESDAARKRELAAASRAAARARVAGFQPPRPPEAGSTPLPVHLWTAVLASLKDRCNAVYDACLAARDVCSAAMACRDLRAAAGDALCGMLPGASSAPGGAKLAQALSQPGRMAKADLRAVCAQLQLPLSGNKPELIVRILDALGMDRPSPVHAARVPAALLLEARRQRRAPGSALQDGGGRTRRSEAIFSMILPPAMSEWQARRHVLGKYGDHPDTLDRIARCACVKCGFEMAGGAAWQWRAYAQCASLACSSCCSDDACQHRVATALHKCSACWSNARSASCNAAMCGLCCPRNNCARHGPRRPS